MLRIAKAAAAGQKEACMNNRYSAPLSGFIVVPLVIVAVLVIVFLPQILFLEPAAPTGHQVYTTAARVADYANDFVAPSTLSKARTEIQQSLDSVNSTAAFKLRVRYGITNYGAYDFQLYSGRHSECVSYTFSTTNEAWEATRGACQLQVGYP